MRHQRALLPFLIGVCLAMIGGMLTFSPHFLFATNGVRIGQDPNLLSEIRGPGGVLLLTGGLLLAAVLSGRQRGFACGVAAVVLLGTALGRIVSLISEGMPAPSLLAALLVELVLGGLCVVLWASVSGPQNGRAT